MISPAHVGQVVQKQGKAVGRQGPRDSLAASQGKKRQSPWTGLCRTRGFGGCIRGTCGVFSVYLYLCGTARHPAIQASRGERVQSLEPSRRFAPEGQTKPRRPIDGIVTDWLTIAGLGQLWEMLKTEGQNPFWEPTFHPSLLRQAACMLPSWGRMHAVCNLQAPPLLLPLTYKAQSSPPSLLLLLLLLALRDRRRWMDWMGGWMSWPTAADASKSDRSERKKTK